MNIRLYHPDSILENNTSLLSKEHTHYIVNVMRLKRGSNLNFFNKNGEWKSEIIFLNKDRVEVRFLEKIKEANNLFKTPFNLGSTNIIFSCRCFNTRFTCIILSPSK